MPDPSLFPVNSLESGVTTTSDSPGNGHRLPSLNRIVATEPVLSPNARHRQAWIALHHRVAECLDPALKNWVVDLDDNLFKQAERGSGVAQTQFFEGLRTLRRLAPGMLQAFWNDLAVSVARSVELVSSSPNSSLPLSNSYAGGLSLVDESALEVVLAGQAAVDRLEHRNAKILGAWRHLWLKAPGDEASSRLREESGMRPPWTPAMLFDVFKRAVISAEWNPAPDVTLIATKHFEKAISELDYSDLIVEFCRQTGLSQERFLSAEAVQHRQAEQSKTQVSRMQREDMKTGGMVTRPTFDSSQAVPVTEQQALFGGLADLIRSRQGSQGSGVVGRVASRESGETVEGRREFETTVLSALDRLLGDLEAAPVDSRGVAAPSQDSIPLSQRLSGRLADWAIPNQMQKSDKVVLDLAGALFDEISRLDSVHPEIRPYLARLKGPCIKAAWWDSSVLSRITHPARLLLEDIIVVGQRLDSKRPMPKSYHDLMEQLVTGLVAIDNPEAQVFEQARTLWQDSQEQVLRSSQHREKKVSEVAAASERVSAAGSLAVSAIQKSLDEVAKQLASKLKTQIAAGEETDPSVDLAWNGLSVLRDFFERIWLRHLMLKSLRTPSGQAEVDDRLKSGNTETASGDDLSERLVGNWLESCLSKDYLGVQPDLSPMRDLSATLSVSEDAIATSMHELGKAILGRSVKEMSGSMDAFSSLSPLKDAKLAKALNFAALEKALDTASGDELEPSPPPPRPEVRSKIEGSDLPTFASLLRQHAPESVVGNWWRLASGDIKRVKLSWIGYFTQRLLFVTVSGSKVLDLSWNEMDALRRSSTITFETEGHILADKLEEVSKKYAVREEVP